MVSQLLNYDIVSTVGPSCIDTCDLCLIHSVSNREGNITYHHNGLTFTPEAEIARFHWHRPYFV